MFIEADCLQLGRGQLLGMSNGKGARVQVLRGKLWVTQEGDRRDLFFGDLERFEIERDGITVLHALSPTRLQVDQTRPAAAKAPGYWKALAARAMRFVADYGARRAGKSRYYRF